MNRKGLWNVLFVGAAMALGVGLSLKPWQVYKVQKAKAEEAKGEMRDAERGRVEVTREKATYESSVGREKLARERGFHFPGEVPAEKQPTGPITD